MNAYFRLMRLHQPTGIWLLLWPCWWSITLASYGTPSVQLLLLFLIGSVAMRGAGCIINDIMDRDIDSHVERTRMRPIASGEVSVAHAIILLCCLLLVALIIALQMNLLVIMLAISSLLLVGTYPLMKRLIWWPQAFLGLTFNWGALMGWAAVTNTLHLPALLLYCSGIFWTLGYDTIYAHQDKEDDAKIGVKSTAIYFGSAGKYWVAVFYALSLFCFFWAAVSARVDSMIGLFILLPAAHCIWQVRTVDFNNAASCLRIFRSNVWLGGLLFAILLLVG